MKSNQKNRGFRFLLVSFLVFALVAGVVFNGFAAEKQKGTSTFKKIWLRVWEILNFLILAYFLFRLLKEPVRNFFQRGSETIRQQFEQAEASSLQAERQMEEMERRFETLEKEIQKLRHAIGEEGEKERDKIISDAKQTAAYMLDKARLEADMMVRNAKMQLRRQVIDEAVGIAEESIRKAIKQKDQERLVDEYMQNLKQLAPS